MKKESGLRVASYRLRVHGHFQAGDSTRNSQPATRNPLTHGRRGFTLLELLVVIAILAALAGITLPVLLRARVKACTVRTKAVMDAIEAALSMYESDFGDYPSSTGKTRGVVELLRGPVSSPRWNGPYLRLKRDDVNAETEIVDAWRLPLVYRYPQTEHPETPFSLASSGPDRRMGTGDDIGNW